MAQAIELPEEVEIGEYNGEQLPVGVDGIVVTQAWGARVEQGQTILLVATPVN